MQLIATPMSAIASQDLRRDQTLSDRMSITDTGIVPYCIDVIARVGLISAIACTKATRKLKPTSISGYWWERADCSQPVIENASTI